MLQFPVTAVQLSTNANAAMGTNQLRTSPNLESSDNGKERGKNMMTYTGTTCAPKETAS